MKERPGEKERIIKVCVDSLGWAAARQYRGYNKHDGLNSPLLSALSLRLRWGRIFWIQAVMRMPFNVRPLLGVRKAVNPKGLALFARALLNLYRATGEPSFRRQGLSLLDRLLGMGVNDFPGMSWGYGYPWQDVGFFAPAWFPNRIVTYFVGRAMIDAFEVTQEERYLHGACQATKFILHAPRVLFETQEEKCVSYVPVDNIEMAVMDVSALCGALCTMTGHHAGRPEWIEEGQRMIRYVVRRQTDYGAWFYTDPPGDSRITHDNYHSGEILDAVLDYIEYSGDDSFRDAHRRGLEFYRRHLFTVQGEPKWMHDRTYPFDIHGYAQGIITFSRVGDDDLSSRITENILRDMYDADEHRFYYQKRRFYTRRFTLMRWCQAWAVFALSYRLCHLESAGDHAPAGRWA